MHTVKRDLVLEKRPAKETYIHRNRPANETQKRDLLGAGSLVHNAVCQKGPVYMKRDL